MHRFARRLASGMLGAGIAVAFAAGSASAGQTSDHSGQNTLQVTKQSNEISQHASSSSQNKQEWTGFFNTPFALGSSDSNNGKVSQGNQSANSWAYNNNHSTQTNNSKETSSSESEGKNKDHNYKGSENSGPCSCGQSGYGNQGKPDSYGGQNNSGSNEGQNQGQGSYQGSYQGQGQSQGTYEGDSEGKGDHSQNSDCSNYKGRDAEDPPGQWTFQRNSIDQQACSSSTNEQKGVLHVNVPIAIGSSDSNNGKVSQGNQSANSGAGNNSWSSQSNTSDEQSSTQGDNQGKYGKDSKDDKGSGTSQSTYQSNNVDQQAKSQSSNTQEGVVYWNTPVAIGSSNVNNGNVSQGNQSANSGAWNNNNSKQSNTSSEQSSSESGSKGKYEDDSSDGKDNGSQGTGQENGIEQSAQSKSSNEQKGVLYVNAPIAIGSSCSNNGNVSQGNQSANSGAGNNNQSTQSNGSQQSQQSQGGQLKWVNPKN